MKPDLKEAVRERLSITGKMTRDDLLEMLYGTSDVRRIARERADKMTLPELHDYVYAAEKKRLAVNSNAVLHTLKNRYRRENHEAFHPLPENGRTNPWVWQLIKTGKGAFDKLDDYWERAFSMQDAIVLLKEVLEAHKSELTPEMRARAEVLLQRWVLNGKRNTQSDG